uniref:LRRCT domain-containing protein n=1 Tax=Gouania willdenowi TaxID=441366 RepID=A0A8C5GBA6_GOUWI
MYDFRGLKKIPPGIPGETTNLTLTINHIPLLNSSSFQGLENLIGPKDHMCTHSVKIEEKTFTKLENLQALYLDGNQLESIPKGLPENLILLSLEVNHIFQIFEANLSEIRNIEILYLGQNCYYQESAFSQLHNLTLLSLKSNNLSFIPPRLPTSLKELYLYNNNIQKVMSNQNGSQAVWLYLKNNKLNSFIWKNLSYLHSLLVLDLSGNSLTTVPPMLSDCTTSLKKLIVHKNQIVKLTSDFLKNAFNLKYLDLSYNHIQNVEESSFPDDVVKQMDMLLLHNNRFHCSCNATWFVKWLNKTTVTIPKLGTEVTCASPGAQRFHLVISVDLLACQHNGLSIILYILLTSLILSFLTMSILSWQILYSSSYPQMYVHVYNLSCFNT